MESKTNDSGHVLISFTVPEALTEWNVFTFAHTRDLKFALSNQTARTVKDLMVFPNIPRFVRERDKITVKAKIANLVEREISGHAVLQLFDALTMEKLDDRFGNSEATRTFTVAAGGSDVVSWDVQVPYGIEAVQYKVLAKSGRFTDGEQSVLPVLKDKMLVTESLPFSIKKKGSETFRLAKLANGYHSGTLQHNRLTLEYTTNPAWYAVQALPYMIEYPYECSEQLFSRFYANSVAAQIIEAHPRIKTVFASWKAEGSDALQSNLEKNMELKALLLEESPWVLDASDERKHKENISRLMDEKRLAEELDRALYKLRQMQMGRGGWSWFAGLPENRFITQHIVSGLGHLEKLQVKSVSSSKVQDAAKKALSYLDGQILEDYQVIVQNQSNVQRRYIHHTNIHYLYMRSFYTRYPVAENSRKAFDYWKSQLKDYWPDHGLYGQAMAALALYRYGDQSTARKIIASLKDRAIVEKDIGMYWRDNVGGYYWYNAPIETQAMLIEAFHEVAKDQKSVAAMQEWLLRQKRVHNWRTTKATTEACYALLLNNSDWEIKDPPDRISLGGKAVFPLESHLEPVQEGTGYIKMAWSGNDIHPEMGEVTIEKAEDGLSWGSLYWQYFERLDKITPHETPLKLSKRLYLEATTATGKILKPIEDGSEVKIGDRVVVRMELRVDRSMEYIHLKDMRAACFEPTTVISTHKNQDGLWYYQSTKDASTNFFINYLPKGTYIFEYTLQATHAGDFSNGIAIIQSMYAPEFSAHSSGVRVIVKP